MDTWLWIVIAAAVVALAVVVWLLISLSRSRRTAPPPTPAPSRSTPPTPRPPEPGDGQRKPTGAVRTEDDVVEAGQARPTGPAPSESPVADTTAAEPTAAEPVVAEPQVEVPEAPATRMSRLRARLARSSSPLGKALLAVLSRDHLTQADWDELEETLLVADVGMEATGEIIEALQRQMRVEGSASPARARELLRAELLDVLDIGASRELVVSGSLDEAGEQMPGVMLVVGVNGSGKTTTIGRIARLLVAEELSVVLGAADTFRAAATEQLSLWGERVGVPVVTGPEGGDPASVAFDTVREARETRADVAIIDTAGRLQNKTNLMDELGKIKKVAARQAPLTEVLLVLDATTGQNGLQQGRVFAEVADVTGIVLTKLDGSAKGGIVISVQRELGVPVKLVGLGEGPDDLAPFDPEEFVDALLSD